LAAALKNEPDTAVQLIDGDKGEFTVSLDGRVVARKADDLPVNDILKKVKESATPAHA
jgi:hypothetical protein